MDAQVRFPIKRPTEEVDPQKLIAAKDATVTQTAAGESKGLGGWVSDNVWTPVKGNVVNPMINGTGLGQIYNTFADKDHQVKELKVAEVHGVVQWGVQTLSEVAGALVPYALAGKMVNGGGRLLGEKIAA